MVIRVKEIKKKKTNYFMTDKEVGELWKFIKKRHSTKFSVILSFALFRGLRIGEICAINILDFEADFTRLKVIIEKSHIYDSLDLIPQHTEIIKEYVLMNKHSFKDGYLFPFYSSKQKGPYMDAKTAEAWFAKTRKQIGIEHPSFLDRHDFPSGQIRYRISFHSCRRWFETKIYDKTPDKKRLADIMRYIDASTVDTYLDPYETWKNERNILQDVFDEKLSLFQNISKGQTQLAAFSEP